MATTTFTPQQFRTRFYERTVSRLEEMPARIANAEQELDALICSDEYDSRVADELELAIARWRREEKRLKRRVKWCEAQLAAVEGTDADIEA